MLSCDCCGSIEWRPYFSENGFELGRCLSCNLFYVQPMPSPDMRMREIEEGRYAGSELTLDPKRQLSNEHFRRRQFESYVDLAQRWSPQGRWLDIGCGAGVLVSMAQEAGYDVEGIELTDDRRLTARSITGAVIHDTPVEDLGFDDGSFDVITMIQVFSHLVAPSRTFEVIARILSADGVFIMATAEVGPAAKKSHLYDWGLGDHLYFLGEGTVERYAQQLEMRLLAHERSSYIDVTYAKDRFSIPGRSPLRNAVKRGIVIVPGALPALKYLMRRAQPDNAVYPSVYVLGH